MRILLLGFIFTCHFSCNYKNEVVISSPDKSQALTIIDINDVRYIINGRMTEIPDSNYIKLDLSRVSSLGDGIQFCWNNEGYLWDVVVVNAEIIELKLDTSKYRFANDLPKKDGIPTEEKFRAENCGAYSFLFEDFVPPGISHVEHGLNISQATIEPRRYWSKFLEKLRMNDVEFLVNHSLDSIRCTDCMLDSSSQQEWYDAESMFTKHIDKLLHLEDLEERPYNSFIDEYRMIISYKVAASMSEEEGYNLIFEFTKVDGEYLFKGMLIT